MSFNIIGYSNILNHFKLKVDWTPRVYYEMNQYIMYGVSADDNLLYSKVGMRIIMGMTHMVH